MKNKMILTSVHQSDIDLYLIHSNWAKANTNFNSSIYSSKPL